MATINRENILHYVNKGLINPSKLKIDLNKNKTTSDNSHRWVTLQSAIDSGYDFNFDYDVPEIKTPTVTKLPEIVVTPETNNDNSDQKNKVHWYDYANKNFENTFGVSTRDAASFIPYIGDALDIKDIGTNLYNRDYLSAGIGTASLFLPNIIEKPAKKLYKGFKRLFLNVNYTDYLNKTSKKILPIPENEAREIIKYNLNNISPKAKKRPGKKEVQYVDRGYDDPYDIGDTYFGGDIKLVKTTKDHRDIIEYAPQYVKWAKSKNLNIDSPETAAKFIDEYSYSLRGVVSDDLEQSKKWATLLNNDLKGGDKFLLKSGIYSGNSSYVGNRYASGNGDTPGVINKIKINYNIDPSLPVIDLLKELSKKSIRFDVFPNQGFPKVSKELEAEYTLNPFLRTLDWNKQGLQTSFQNIHPSKNKIGRVKGYRFKDKTPVMTLELPFSSNFKDPLQGVFERGSLYPLTLISQTKINPTKREKFRTVLEMNLEESFNDQLYTPFIFNSPDMVDYYTKLWKIGVDKKKVKNPIATSRVRQALLLREKNKNKALLYGGIGTGLGVGAYTLSNIFNDNNESNELEDDFNIYDDFEKLK